MENRTFNILFLGGAKRNSIAESFMREGKNLGLSVSIFGYELDEICPLYFVAKKIICGKKWSDNNIFEDLLNIIDHHQINMVIPFVDPAVEIVSVLKDKGTKEKSNTFFVGSDLDVTKIFYDKIKANQWCIENKIQVPHEDLKQFPLIAKPVHGSASKGIEIINDEQKLEGINRDNYLVQEYVSGPEYTVDCYVPYTDGAPIIAVPRVRLETQGGESIKTITIRDQDLIKRAQEILLKSGLKGPNTIQFISSEKTKYFMELNPRFGGGVLTSIGAGAVFTKYLLQEALNTPLDENVEWKSNFMMIRTFKEYYYHADNY